MWIKRDWIAEKCLSQESIYHYSVHRRQCILSFSQRNDVNCTQACCWRTDRGFLCSLHVRARDKLRLERWFCHHRLARWISRRHRMIYLLSSSHDCSYQMLRAPIRKRKRMCLLHSSLTGFACSHHRSKRLGPFLAVTFIYHLVCFILSFFLCSPESSEKIANINEEAERRARLATIDGSILSRPAIVALSCSRARAFSLVIVLLVDR